METKSLETKTCVVCGKPFTPNAPDDLCCSPFCRTMRITAAVAEKKKQEKERLAATLDSMERPPRFNLAENPKARAEWFMSLPAEYKSKFLPFLTNQDLEIAKSIEQKRMAEDRFLSGFFVKRGKIVEVKSSGEELGTDIDTEADKQNTDGTDFFD